MSEAAERVREQIRILRETRARLVAHASGEAGEGGGPAAHELAEALGAARDALDAVPRALRELVAREDVESVDAWGEMLEVVEEDARRARAAVRLARGEGAVTPALAGALADHVHLRAVLSDLDLVARALR